ncbi:VOC family protein [Novosphingobium colocasiae]
MAGCSTAPRSPFSVKNPSEHHQIVFISSPEAEGSAKVLNQMSFRLDSLATLLEFAKRLDGEKVTDLEPVIHGNAWSLYFRDPAGNRVEVFTDSDWYIEQPIKEPLDFFAERG